jgi:hypothetical protein
MVLFPFFAFLRILLAFFFHALTEFFVHFAAFLLAGLRVFFAFFTHLLATLFHFLAALGLILAPGLHVFFHLATFVGIGLAALVQWVIAGRRWLIRGVREGSGR